MVAGHCPGHTPVSLCAWGLRRHRATVWSRLTHSSATTTRKWLHVRECARGGQAQRTGSVVHGVRGVCVRVLLQHVAQSKSVAACTVQGRWLGSAGHATGCGSRLRSIPKPTATRRTPRPLRPQSRAHMQPNKHTRTQRRHTRARTHASQRGIALSNPAYSCRALWKHSP